MRGIVGTLWRKLITYYQNSHCYIVLQLLFQPIIVYFPPYSVIFLEEDLLLTLSLRCVHSWPVVVNGRVDSVQTNIVDNGNIDINIHLQFNTYI